MLLKSRLFSLSLAVQKNVAASTQNQALNAIVFLYHEVLKQDKCERLGKSSHDAPSIVIPPLQEHLCRVRRLHQQDLERGFGSVYLPFALAKVSQCR
ncbi:MULTISPECIES: phage integrase N-terminal SAM-like domain-containing protein [Leptolyngbya]|uniref:phage integrase N-terminal SAM-like domain-containing protein n=1 Tax=Leptolyngbya TaxID=47251 RepID=UPI0003A9EFB2|nr:MULTISPECIES: phage integrase N-terminal SAM-like domain-containing protein [Leptolyngbya]